MAITRHRASALNPWQELNEMRNRVRNVFADPLNLDAFMPESLSFTPAVEISDEDGEILVTAELPGMTKDQVEIEMQDNVLTLRGEKKEEREEKEKERYLYERSYGSFQRSFTLPTAVDEDNVRAEFTDGVLRVHLPKIRKASGRKISIG